MIDSRKPAPDMLLKTIHDLGGGPTLYVGDSEIDAETAKRAHIPFALYTGGYHKAPLREHPPRLVLRRFQRTAGYCERTPPPGAGRQLGLLFRTSARAIRDPAPASPISHLTLPIHHIPYREFLAWCFA